MIRNCEGVGCSLLQEDCVMIPKRFSSGSWHNFDVIKNLNFSFPVRHASSSSVLEMVTRRPVAVDLLKKPPLPLLLA